MVEKGIVKFFDEREGKRFGFLIVLDANGTPTKEEIFFHYNDGKLIGNDGEVPIFMGHTTKRDGRLKRLRRPQKDDKLIFERSEGRKGDKASPWGYVSSWDKQVDWLANRPVYRVVKTGSNYGKPYSTTVWEGTDIIDLSAQYPVRSESRSRRGTADRLGAGTADNGDMYWHHNFEILVDGDWRPCDDPRVENCCVPRQQLKQYNPGYYQDNCYHK